MLFKHCKDSIYLQTLYGKKEGECYCDMAKIVVLRNVLLPFLFFLI